MGKPQQQPANGNGAKRPAISQKQFEDALRKVSRKIPAGKSK